MFEDIDKALSKQYCAYTACGSKDVTPNSEKKLDGQIICMKCEDFMRDIAKMYGKLFNVILTAPFGYKECAVGCRQFSEHLISEITYVNLVTEWFDLFDKVVSDTGIVVMDMQYINAKPWVAQRILSDVTEHTKWCVLDFMVNCYAPAQEENNKGLTRVCSPVYIFCKKNHRDDIKCNGGTNIAYFDRTSWDDLLERKNKPFSKDAFQYNFVNKVLDMYRKDDSFVYDPFIGNGTTGRVCKDLCIKWCGTEIDVDKAKLAKDCVNGIFEV